MQIQIYHLLEGAKKAEGFTVVIDVFRAFSLACYMADQNAKEILPVADLDLAYRLKKEIPGSLLIGERNERIPPGFDFGNSPTYLLGINLEGKTIIHTTSAGTQGLVNATPADIRVTGSFVNAPAIVEYIQKVKPEVVSLICMGYGMKHPTEEDTYCAEFIKNSLEGKPNPVDDMMDTIKKTSARRLFDPANQEFSPSSDFMLCTDIGRFDFVLEAYYSDNILKLKKINRKDFCR